MSGAAILPFVRRSRETAREPIAGGQVIPLRRVAVTLPPRPESLATCVAWLQEEPAVLAERPVALRALRQLEAELFALPRQGLGLHSIWQESVASACMARLLAVYLGLDAGLLVGAALLHRLGDVWPAAQLADAWQLAPPVTRVLRDWRSSLEESEPGGPEMNPVRAVYLAHLFAVEQLYGEYCTPGIVEVAARELGVPWSVLGAVRAQAAGINRLLGKLA